MVSDFAQETNPLRKPWLASGLREKNMSWYELLCLCLYLNLTYLPIYLYIYTYI
jgi:hypothetical protein